MHRVPLNEVPTALMQIELLRRAIERHQATIDQHEQALAKMRAKQTRQSAKRAACAWAISPATPSPPKPSAALKSP